MTIPIITLDGPSGSGKGTIGHLLAQHLKWHYLDSGALYRALTWLALQQKIDLADEQSLATLAKDFQIDFQNPQGEAGVFYQAQDISQAIRSEDISRATSQVAALPLVRTALLQKQRSFATTPGLITDGRDMGTVVFPNAYCKIFLEASVHERGLRRYHQLQALGIPARLEEILADLEARDLRDKMRATAPLKPATDAYVLDTSGLSIDKVFKRSLEIIQTKLTQKS